MSATLTVGTFAQVACLLEVSARKPGNVHRLKDFADATYLDFVLSASALGRSVERAAEAGVGAAVLDAVTATRALVATNTNLGMALLLAPLAAVPLSVSLRPGVADVLAATTVDDARVVYRAIRLANPGGLGSAPEQDVAGEPTVTLLDAMRLATDRDAVARQYANGFADVFETGLPALSEAMNERRDVETAIILAHLRLLARVPDTLIARKRGWGEALEASERARDVLFAGWPDSEPGRRRFDELDGWLNASGHARNPGTTADLVAAALFAALRDGTIRLPMGPATTPWSPPLV
jgi:triphosphoribosyl-dephospho-CoA synthase